MVRDRDRGFEAFVRDASPRLRRAFVPVRGVEGAAVAAAEPLALGAHLRHGHHPLTVHHPRRWLTWSGVC